MLVACILAFAKSLYLRHRTMLAPSPIWKTARIPYTDPQKTYIWLNETVYEADDAALLKNVDPENSY